ncbi:MAG: hypothetical protein U0T69_12910 [Chitinophagales bacterium]
MNNKIFLLTFATLCIFLSACSSCNKRKRKSNIDRTNSIADAKMLPSEQLKVIDVVYLWNAAHDSIHF